MNALKWITSKAKALKKKHPGKKWTTYTKEASAEYRRTHKKKVGSAKNVHHRKRKVGKAKISRPKRKVGTTKRKSIIPGTGISLGAAKAAIIGSVKKRLSSALLKRELAKNKTSHRKFQKEITQLKREVKKYC